MAEKQPALELVIIGDELLDGRTHEGNGHFLAQRCRARGMELARVTIVQDRVEDIAQVVLEAASRVPFVVTSGGLGPTRDDRTRQALAHAAGVALVQDIAATERLDEKYRTRHFVMTKAKLRQAWFPEGSRVLPSAVGTAEPFEIGVGDARVVALPGVPAEFRALAKPYVLDELAGEASRTYRRFHLFGKSESAIAERVESLLLPGCVKVTYNSRLPIVDVEFSTLRDPELMDAALDRARAKLGPFLFEAVSRTPAESVLNTLKRQSGTLAVAESCTGGWVTSSITDVPGASDSFLQGFTTYSNGAKESALGVSSSTLKAHGAVSFETAIEMAEGARRAANSSLAISITGIAGPGGGTDEKPVGTVYLGASTADRQAVVHAVFGQLHRQQFKAVAGTMALMLGLRMLENRVPELRALYGVREVRES